MSSQIEEICGYAAAAFVTDPDLLWRIVHPDDREEVRTATDAAVAAEGEFSLEDGALALSEGRFRNAFENAPIGMSLVSSEGHWLRVNGALCEIVGYSRRSSSGAPSTTSPIRTTSRPTSHT